MSDTILPKTIESTEPQSFEPRDVEVVGIENPTGKTDETAPVINMSKLQEFLGISHPDYKEINVLNNLYNYFSKKGADSMDEVFMEINFIEQKLGSVPIGQTRLQHLWNYLKVLSLTDHYNNLRKSFERS